MSDCRFGVSPVNYPDPDPGGGGGGGGKLSRPYRENFGLLSPATLQ